jgi:hypothetical protein
VFNVRQVHQPYLVGVLPAMRSSARSGHTSRSATPAGPGQHPGHGRHVGFRHEHTRPESGTCFEDNNWRALTAYDASSVMHYPQCNGTQNGDLVLTNQDKAGASALYP